MDTVLLAGTRWKHPCKFPTGGRRAVWVRGVGDPTAREGWWGQSCERSELSGLFEWAGRACGPAAGLYGLGRVEGGGEVGEPGREGGPCRTKWRAYGRDGW